MPADTRGEIRDRPPIQDGFYYDFDLPSRSARATSRDRGGDARIVAADQPFVREEVGREEALARLDGQSFKREIVESIGAAEGEVAEGDVVSLYRNDGWVDLCEGPHVPSTGRLGAFRLTSTAGAYWRGSETNPMLTRIYGTAWAPRRTSRTTSRSSRRPRNATIAASAASSISSRAPTSSAPACGSGIRAAASSASSSRTGCAICISNAVRAGRDAAHRTLGALGDQRPPREVLENMYPPMETDTGDYYAKPMNCPFHVLVYKSQVRSYRDLPMRLSELGTIYRHEKIGTLHGLLRIRGGTQDDSHIICTPEQLIDEIRRCST